MVSLQFKEKTSPTIEKVIGTSPTISLLKNNDITSNMTTTFQQKNDMNVAIKLIPEVPPEKEEDKSKFITIELKCQAGGRASSPTYKKHIRTFENGTPKNMLL